MKQVQMKGIGLRLASLALTCLIGFVATNAFDRVYLRFESVGMGSIAMGPNGQGGFISYRASDGVNLNFDHLDFPSAEEAKEAFKNVLDGSSKIITREFVRDREGRSVVGERVIGLFSADDGREWPMMVCHDGSKLYEISSTSLRHILIFEKAHRRY
jgi:hypothetical protein